MILRMIRLSIRKVVVPMKKKSIAMAAAATAASTGAVLMAAKKVQQKNKEQKAKKEEDIKNYRNTELGNMIKIKKVFITQMGIMKHLHVQKNQRE